MKMTNGKIELWDFHRERLEIACRHFHYPITDWTHLLKHVEGNHKIRLLVGKKESRIEVLDLPQNPITVITVDSIHTETSDYTRFKTTHRKVYIEAQERHRAYDDVVLWNQDDFILETSISNIILEKDGKWYTPDFSLGMHVGTYLRYLLTTREIIQAKILYTDIHEYKIYCCNSVRGLYPVNIE